MENGNVGIARLTEINAELVAALQEAETALMRCEFAGAKTMDGGIGAIDSALLVIRAALAKATSPKTCIRACDSCACHEGVVS